MSNVSEHLDEPNAVQIANPADSVETRNRAARRSASREPQPGRSSLLGASQRARASATGRMRAWYWVWAPTAALAASVYLLIHLGVDRWLPGELSTYIAQPMP